MILTLYLISNYTLKIYSRWQPCNVFMQESLHIETFNARFCQFLIALSDMSCKTVHWSSFIIQFTKKGEMFLLYIFKICMLLTKSRYKCLFAIYTRLQLSTKKRLHVNATNMRYEFCPHVRDNIFVLKRRMEFFRVKKRSLRVFMWTN